MVESDDEYEDYEAAPDESDSDDDNDYLNLMVDSDLDKLSFFICVALVTVCSKDNKFFSQTSGKWR